MIYFHFFAFFASAEEVTILEDHFEIEKFTLNRKYFAKTEAIKRNEEPEICSDTSVEGSGINSLTEEIMTEV